MIDAAIVGLGRWGKGFLESVQGKSRRIRFVRGVDTAPDVARDLAARHGFKPSSDLAEALADPAVQALVLVTPHSLHREQVVACARAGKPVFCEKPLALTMADARIMVDACVRAGVVLGAGHNRRWWPAMRELKRALSAAGTLYLTVNCRTRWGYLMHRALSRLAVDAGHPHTFTPRRAERLLRDHGFRTLQFEIASYAAARRADFAAPERRARLKALLGVSEFVTSVVAQPTHSG